MPAEEKPAVAAGFFLPEGIVTLGVGFVGEGGGAV